MNCVVCGVAESQTPLSDYHFTSLLTQSMPTPSVSPGSGKGPRSLVPLKSALRTEDGLCFRSSAGEPLGSFHFGAAVRDAAVNSRGQASVGFPSSWLGVGLASGRPCANRVGAADRAPAAGALTVFYCSDHCLPSVPP